MRKIVVRGGNALSGEVKVAGAKNSALKIMAAAILTDEPVAVSNVPSIKDVSVMAEVLKGLGLEVSRDNGTVTLRAEEPIGNEAPFDLVSKMRASVIVLGPLLGRFGRAKVAMPGGCNIGLRKIDLHIRGLEMLGAKIDVGGAAIEATADKLVGARIPLDFPSVGATENIMMAACLAQGTTTIENAAREPEIVDLADCLKKMGAAISGAGTSTIVIEGTDRLKGASWDVIPDRIEASTFLVAAAITGGDVKVTSVCPDHLSMIIKKLREAQFDIEVGDESIRLIGGQRPKAIDLATLPYPGFPTDMQAPFMSLLSLADGNSVITENVFESRFAFAGELSNLGGKIDVTNHHAVVSGNRSFHGAAVKMPDLRAGAALVLAGLAADGVVEISDIDHIERGYEDFTARLRALGADIQSVEDEEILNMTSRFQEGTQYFMPDVSAGV